MGFSRPQTSRNPYFLSPLGRKWVKQWNWRAKIRGRLRTFGAVSTTWQYSAGLWASRPWPRRHSCRLAWHLNSISQADANFYGQIACWIATSPHEILFPSFLIGIWAQVSRHQRPSRNASRKSAPNCVSLVEISGGGNLYNNIQTSVSSRSWMWSKALVSKMQKNCFSL